MREIPSLLKIKVSISIETVTAHVMIVMKARRKRKTSTTTNARRSWKVESVGNSILYLSSDCALCLMARAMAIVSYTNKLQSILQAMMKLGGISSEKRLSTSSLTRLETHTSQYM